MAVIVSISVLASVPPVARDELTHHLTIPKLYLIHGGIYEIPEIIFSYYPMNLELIYAVPLYFHNDIIPKYIHFGFALAATGLIFIYLRRRTNVTYALLGALIFLSTPIIVRLSISAYVDLGLIFFSFASLYYLLRWIENDFQVYLLFLSACFCGLALGTKYNALIFFLLMSSFVAFITSRHHRREGRYYRKVFGFTLFFIIISSILFFPWMIRNYFWTQNPIYPLFNSIINPGHPVPDTYISKFNLFYLRKALYGESWIETLLVPIRIFFQGVDDSPRFFDGKLNPFLLILPFFAFFGFSRQIPLYRNEKILFVLFSFLYLVFVFYQHDMRIRYIGPIIPLLVILSVFGINNLLEFKILKSKSINYFLVCSILSVLFLINGIYLYGQFESMQPLTYISGGIDRDAYIEKFIPEYPVMQHANANLNKNDKILAIYAGDRGYYSNLPIVFNINLLRKCAADMSSPEEVSLELKKKGITHLLINHRLFNYWANQYDDREKIILKSFFDHCSKMIFFKNEFGLYELTTSKN